MSTANKITFGNTSGTTYSINNPTSFGYTTGDYIQPATTNYQGQSTTYYGGTSSNYQPYVENREVVYGGQRISQGFSVPTNYSTLQVGNPTNVAYGASHEITRAAPVTKITFGGKQIGQTYRVPQYETTSTYTAPTYTAPVTTSYQTYQTYTQPAEIPTVTSQPIREEVRVEQHVYQPKQVEREEVVTAPVVNTVPAPVDEKRKAKKKGFACPSWIWYLLGALLLIGLIIGLIFLFKNLNVGGGSTPSINTNGEGTATATTGGSTKATTGNVSGGSTPESTSGSTTGTTFVTPSDTTNTTSGTTTTTGTTNTIDTNVTPVIPVTQVDDDSFAIDPVAIAPTAVTSINTQTVANPVTTITTLQSSNWPSRSSGTWSSSDAQSSPASTTSTNDSDLGQVAIADPARAFIPTTAPSVDDSTGVASTSVY